ncbi:hypothetical protein D9613_008811 [Agrocybe pediades]|uniref:F-box domain-containing protein n=1 Tax=Agrocybe pediades TaxID=84607 RepID=A0A8H4QSS9_9AGAR|nr:hypothetical protein D9613_008811 [Agrocybe pediades]
MEKHTTPFQHRKSYSRSRRPYFKKIGNSRASRAPKNLPVELHEHIVNMLEGKTEALKQCSLTCRLYRHFAQKLLFKSIAFDLEPYPNTRVLTLVEFLDILRASPQIAGHVQKLFIYHLDANITPLRDQEATTQVLQALPSVVNLHLRGRNRYCRTWFPMHHAMKDRYENLRSLTLHNMWPVHWDLFDHLRRLEMLDMMDVFFYYCNPKAQVAQPAPYRIKHMNLERVRVFVETIFPSFVSRGIGIGGLESLSIDMSPITWQALPLPHFHAAKSLIRSSAGSLKSLKVSGSLCGMYSVNVHLVPQSRKLTCKSGFIVSLVHLPNAGPLFDVSEMPLLQEWFLSEKDHENGLSKLARNPFSLDWISRHLETIPAGRKLKKITLHLAIHGALVTDDRLDIESFKYFEKLVVDAVLCRTEFFSIKFLPYLLEESLIQEQMRKHLPTLHALNLLHFYDFYG